ncbi:hypothetical protein A3D68_00915 [Candidatus Adlerbacteria bacterium RIFCSPHIGHO2_02_FULL_52_17]|uniref:Uncharacterized protein n=1 Tax=Candidatus Adlerbacteria bacterium RIFCSPHIGHO2_02_FULL_52_17 TaxID=1797240 RepID=A0A1F4XR17_9BACT|nr:MAG: hypothetical protein A3D68_00915 [Candidatus Adlerbacteria bacterium RIFCSPHIGHO2_02_FULL_52_17]
MGLLSGKNTLALYVVHQSLPALIKKHVVGVVLTLTELVSNIIPGRERTKYNIYEDSSFAY